MSVSQVIGSGGGCFRKGTQIQLEHGKTVAIDSLKEGDEVLAFDEAGDIHVAKVIKLHIHEEPQPILRVKFWRGEIFVTPNHWVLNQFCSFVEMSTLSIDDALVDSMGHLRPIIEMEHVGFEEVYNLTVEPHHTFIADGVRVHNGGHRERYPEVKGAGGGSKSTGGRVAVEARDTLRSHAQVSLIDLLGEGEIGGLVDGAKSIFLDDTPLMSASGGYNFTNVEWDFRPGTPNQSIIPNFSDVGTPVVASHALTTSAPYTFTVSNPNVDRVRIVMNVLSLMRQDPATGDINGAQVKYQFAMSVDGGPMSVIGDDITIKGKTRSKYQRAHLIDLPKPGSTWTIQVRRLTADSSSSALSNATQVDSYVEITDVKLNYPNSALVSMAFDPESFSRVPRRSYLVDGAYIQVPSNYDPVTRTYAGIWNGTFKVAISNNPAWWLYELLVNKRVGLGDYISSNQVNKAKLYLVGKYCDELVDNGYGSLEPRFTINTSIQTRAEAYKLISDIASVFRGMAFWGGEMVDFTNDAPSPGVGMVFSQANVVDGLFNYVGSSRKDRHSVVLVTWNDPASNYKQRVAYVEDAELIQKIGYKKLETIAFGCTSEAQAIRAGRWILYTERYETNLITFKVGMDAALVMPGEVIRIHEPTRAGKRMSGRIKSATTTSVTLDAPVTLDTSNATISVRLPDGTFVDRQVNQGIGSHSVLTWTSALSVVPSKMAMFVVSETNLVPMLARVINVKPGEGDQKHTYEIACVEHNPTKYNAVESNLLIEQPQTSIVDPFNENPTNISIDESTYFIAPGVIGSKLHISWEGKAKYFEVSYRITVDDETSNWHIETITVPSYEILGLRAGSVVDIRVIAVSSKDVRSLPLDATYSILGKTAAPSPPTNLTAQPQGSRSVLLRWTNPADIDFDHVEIYMSVPAEPENPEDPLSVQAAIDAADNGLLAERIARTSGDTFLVTGLPPQAVTRFFWAKAVDTSGNKSQFNAIPGTSASTEAEADYMVALLENKIGSSTLSQELAERIDGAGDLGIVVQAQQEVIDGVLGKYTVKIDHNGYVSGYGLMSEENDGAIISEFAVRADRFSIGSPSGSTSELATPFMVLSTPTVIDGTTFDPGVYMNSAMITKLTASQIDTRGLTVRGDDGRIILSTDVPLDYETDVTNKPEMISFHDTFQFGLSSSWFESPDSIKNGVFGVEDSIGALSGGRVLRVGNNSGNNMVWFVNSQKFAFDHGALYQIKCRVRRLAGTGSVYVGLVGVGADGVTLVNKNGANGLADQHFVVASGANPGNSWVEYVGYVKGVALQGTSVAAPSIESPGVLHQNVRFVRPVLIANYSNQSGITEFDVFSMTQITADLSTGASVRYIYSEFATPPALPPSDQTTGWDITSSEFAIWASLQINTTSPSGVITEYGPWGQPVRIKGNTGPSGASGQAVDIIFRRSAGQPATPNSSLNLPNLWHTDVNSVPNGPNPLWSCVGKRSDPGANWIWETPVKISGETVVELLTFRRFASQPTTPTGGTYNAATNVFTPPTNWSSSIPSGTDPVWVSVGLVTIGGSETIGTPTWSTAAKAFQDGQSGLNGSRTAILDMYRWSASPPTSFPSGSSTYTWATAQFTAPSSPNGWSLTPPSPVSGHNLYICRQLYSDNNTSSQTTIAWTANTAQAIGKAGSDGQPGQDAQYVTVSSEQAFKYTGGSSTPVNTTIIMTATLFGGLSGYQWQYWNGSSWANFTSNTGSTYSLTHNNAAWGTSQALRVRCLSGGKFDETTIVKLYDGESGAQGSNARVGFLTNESHSVATNSLGGGYALGSAGGFFKVFDGTSDVSGSSAYTVSGGSVSGGNHVRTLNGLTMTINRTTGQYSLSGSSWSSDSLSFDLVAIYGGTSIAKTYTIVKAKAGATGVSISGVVNNYLASSSSSGVTTATPGWTTTVQTITAVNKFLWNYETITYSNGATTVTTPTIIGVHGSEGRGITSVLEEYAVGSSSSTAPTSWSTTLQTTTTTNRFLWNRETITYTDSTTSSAQRVIGTHGATGTNGTNGANGTRTAFLELYKWAATKPASSFPSGSSTYTWATGAFTLPSSHNGWTLLPGDAVPGQTLWAVGQVYSDSNTTAQSNVTWSITSSKVHAVGAAGTNGTNGQGQVKSFAFRRQTSAPSTPTGGTFSSPNPTTSGWSDGIPSGSNPIWVTTRIFTSDGLSPAQGAWSTPVLFALNGESANGGSVRYKFSSNATAPATGTGSSTYPGSNWTINASSSTIWMTQQVNAVNPSGTIVSHGNWSTPVKIKGEDGPSVTINPSRAATFTSTDGVLNSGQTSIVFTAAVFNIASPSYAWSITRQGGSGTTPTASSSSSYTVTAANMGTSKSVIVTCTVNGTYVAKTTIATLDSSTAEPNATAGATFTPGQPGTIVGTIPNQAAFDLYLGSVKIKRSHIDNLTVDTADIVDGAVKNAKIDNAAINTLKIAGNAVSSTFFVSTDDAFNLNSKWTTIASITVAVSGLGTGETANVDLLGMAKTPSAIHTQLVGNANQVLRSAARFQMRILRGSTLVAQTSSDILRSTENSVGGSDNVANGTYTYHLQMIRHWTHPENFYGVYRARDAHFTLRLTKR